MSLIDETKKAMGYTPLTPRCKDCKFYTEIENLYVDRDWIETCTYSNLTHFRVDSLRGSCTKFELK